MKQLFTNNANTTVAVSISSGTLTLSVATGTGALFPAPGAGEYFYVTIIDPATGLTKEIVKCTARAGDLLTIVRAQDGTSATALNAGDQVKLRWGRINITDAVNGTENVQFGNILNGSGGISTPTYSFAADSDTGFWWQSSGLTIFTSNGSNNVLLGNGIAVIAGGVFGWSAGDPTLTVMDVVLRRDAANILALRNATTAQAYRVYNTFTDLSNYERADITWNTNVLEIGAANAGTGTLRGVKLKAASITFTTAGVDQVFLDTNGDLYPFTNATRRIGLSTNGFIGSYFTVSELGGTTKTLTESAATGLCDIAIASNSCVSGRLMYIIEANDATDYQVRTGSVYFTAVNKAGVITTNLGTVINEAVSVSAGTLTVTITSATGASKITLQANAVSSLTQTTLQCKWRVESPDLLTITTL